MRAAFALRIAPWPASTTAPVRVGGSPKRGGPHRARGHRTRRRHAAQAALRQRRLGSSSPPAALLPPPDAVRLCAPNPSFSLRRRALPLGKPAVLRYQPPAEP